MKLHHFKNITNFIFPRLCMIWAPHCVSRLMVRKWKCNERVWGGCGLCRRGRWKMAVMTVGRLSAWYHKKVYPFLWITRQNKLIYLKIHWTAMTCWSQFIMTSIRLEFNAAWTLSCFEDFSPYDASLSQTKWT